MGEVFERVKDCVDIIRKKTDFVPRTAIILGSGLGEFAQAVQIETIIPYDEIDGFPVSTVSGHQGRFLFGTIGEEPVVIMQGRVHYYEGYPMQDVVLPVRVMKLLGAENLILTNAAGGINREFSPGDLMLLTGHISALVPSPLLGPNIDELGTRFPDMTEVYDSALRQKVQQAAADIGVNLRQGVYLQTTGPNYETPDEIRLYGLWGADAVGMSTVCEAIAAKHMGMHICGISCITNMAAGLGKSELNHNEVKETADKAAESFQKLLLGFIEKL